MTHLAVTVLIWLAGIGAGWVHAHSTIATECERLGRFYVGTKVYECVRNAPSVVGEP